jgi:hypothetical protein
MSHPTPVKQIAADYGLLADDFSAGRLKELIIPKLG